MQFSNNAKKMNILLCSTEVTPFAKTGGLADVCNYLPKEWQKMGHKSVIIMPKYGFIDLNKYNFERTDLVINVPMGHNIESAVLWRGYLPESKVEVYLIEYEAYFNRPFIYGDNSEYMDNDRRFIFISRAVFEVAKVIDFKPDIIHAHDYHLSFTMPFLKIYYRFDPFFAKTAGVFTIHNLAYQGKFNQFRVMDYSGFGMKEFYKDSWFEHDSIVNFMKVGVMFADKVTTVSPNYAKEIRIPYYGEGLHQILNEKSHDLVGILNGVDYSEWNPEIDNLIYSKYNIDEFDKKYNNKFELQKEMGLNPNNQAELPIFGMVTRLTEQKGFEIIRETLIKLLEARKIKFVILGSGESEYIEFFNYLKYRFPENVATYFGFDNTLSHKIIAGSDFFLLPSRFEPCGLTQMYSLKYGTLPIVRATGGLVDTVKEYSYEYQNGDGIVFNNFSGNDFEYATVRAIDLYKTSAHFDIARRNAMSKDYSSHLSAINYLSVFNWALEKLV